MQTLAVRPPHHVLEQVLRDRRLRLVDRHRVVRQQLLRAAWLAVHVVLADQRLRPYPAARVLAEGLEAGLRDLGGDDRLRRQAVRHREARRGAGLDAADLQVAAARQTERVVEDDLDRLALAAAGVGAHEHHGGPEGADHDEYRGDPLHPPGE
jgi:hypothetical protein